MISYHEYRHDRTGAIIETNFDVCTLAQAVRRLPLHISYKNVKKHVLEFRANFIHFLGSFLPASTYPSLLMLDYSGAIVDLGHGNLKNKQKCKNFLSKNSIFLVPKQIG